MELEKLDQSLDQCSDNLLILLLAPIAAVRVKLLIHLVKNVWVMVE